MRVVIIGAGVAGLGVGWRLLQAGVSVVILDRGQRIAVPLHDHIDRQQATIFQSLHVEQTAIFQGLARGTRTQNAPS